jgi:hypothetical protein
MRIEFTDDGAADLMDDSTRCQIWIERILNATHLDRMYHLGRRSPFPTQPRSVCMKEVRPLITAGEAGPRNFTTTFTIDVEVTPK